ncbi:MinD superfamily P-loop ATPase [Breznakibacter xylanolyticus]|uniref:MinD superfamily P-loop ATPase n=2 Tax=Breznakibacter xylanolyticus TaxID=990 RepID=A0A2W7NTU6_9BACT|nr:MinD superfamily P-loop ATPase [Breznakibacter xylanolyticus]
MPMIEISILSGKGGTGKTSLSAAFATLQHNITVADCDVDAANLHIVLNPVNTTDESFTTGYKAILDADKCTQCGLCVDFCRFNAIGWKDDQVVINETYCDGCKLCSRLCPNEAITMIPSDKSHWFSGTYRNGLMVHARLAPGEENSGKLVAVVRDQARKAAEAAHHQTIIIDGPPGIGCPVISSMTGAQVAVIVTEPSRSGFHDMKRIIEVAQNFNIQCCVVINKYDLNIHMTEEIEQWCRDHHISLAGNLPFDAQVVQAMLNCKSIVEWQPNGSTTKAVMQIWQHLQQLIHVSGKEAINHHAQ